MGKGQNFSEIDNLSKLPGKGDQGFSTRVPREIVIEKKTSFLNLLAKINRSTEKYHSLLKKSIDNYYWIIISTAY
jgi:hypothetical protein